MELHRVLRIIRKTGLWIISCILVFILAIIILLNIPQVQNILKDSAIKYLSKKLEVPVRLKRLKIDFPNSIELDNLYLQDRRGDTLIYSGRLYAGIDMIALLSGHIRINDLQWSHFRGNIYRTLADTAFNFSFIIKAFSSKEPSDTSHSSLSLKVGSVAFSDMHITYKDALAGKDAEVYLGRFKVRFRKFDLNDRLINMEKLVIDSTSVAFRLYRQGIPPATDTTGGKKEDHRPSPDNWTIRLGQLTMAGNNIKFDNDNNPRSARGIDYNHFDVRDLNMNVHNTFYSEDSSHAKINQISFREKSGFDLKKLTADAVYSLHTAGLKDLDLETNHSVIRKYLAIDYDSPEAIGKDPGHLGIKASLDGCRLDMRDVLYFIPSLDSNPSLRKLMHAVIDIQGNLSGKLNDLAIDKLVIHAAKQTRLAVNAHLKELTDSKKAFFTVDLADFSSGSHDLHALLPARMIPSSISIPASFSVRGTYKGSLHNFTSALFFHSSDGNAFLKAKVDNLNDSLHAAYDLLVRANRLDLGKLLKNDTLYGQTTLNARIKGSGLNRNSLHASLRGQIEQVYLKGYNYHRIAFAGNYHEQKGVVRIASGDPNIRFKLVSSVNFSGRYPAVKVTLDIDSADLLALHLAEDTMKLRGKIRADLTTADPDYLNGGIWLSDWQVVKGSRRIYIDSMSLTSMATDTIDRLKVDAPFASAEISGSYKLSKAGDLLRALAGHYFGADSAMLAMTDSAGRQDIHLKMVLYNHPVWQLVVPSLSSFKGVTLSGEVSSDSQKIRLAASVEQLIMGELQVDSLQLHLRSDANKLQYSIAAGEVHRGSLEVHQTTLSGDAAQNRIHITLNVKDAQHRDKYHLAGTLNLNKNSDHFSFSPSLLLNYDTWKVPEDNELVYEQKGITAKDIRIENHGQYIFIHSPQKEPGTPVQADFHHFKLQTLTKIVSADSALVSGAINGEITADNLLKDPVFTADLTIDSFSIKDRPVGKVAIKINNKISNAYSLNLALTGDSNNLKISGLYYTNPESKFDLNVDMAPLTMASVQAFTFGQLTKGSGALTGHLHLQGTTDHPSITGNLTFKNAAVNITKVNDYLRMPDETIRFDGSGIHFDHFTIIDSLNNKAVVQGSLLTSNFRHYRFNLDLTAHQFRVLNARQSQGEQFYGPVYIDAQVKVRGNENLPRVDANVKVDKKSIFTMTLPSSTPAVESSEGVVEFIDAGHLNDTVQLAAAADTVRRSPLKGIQLSADIAVDSEAVLSMIIDPATGDNLRVQGDATLNMTVDPGGKISLTGRYLISEGTYQMSLESFIKRKFEILQGSTITWQGDPASAVLDLKASYHIETPAAELVEDQIGGLSESEKNTYKQKLPFNVLMNIQGQLMKPDISFQIDMPENARNALGGQVYTRIRQVDEDESEVNKQVLGLLIFGHFIADNPFQSSGGGGVGQLARQSASKILSQELNNLAGSLVQGVDINFDLQSSQDYSTGTAQNKTNLNVGLSKSLFNGRTTVYVGSDIQLEGPQQPDQQSSQIAGDVAIEYKLSRNGRYRLRAYRKNKYEGVIEGQFIETGLSFIIVMDYDHFREIFEKAKKREEAKR